jgi:4-amino-4-deoxy-L-arabinose transferase-like glycosyltransferase
MAANQHELLPLGALLLLGALAFVHLMAVPAFEDEGSQLRLIWRALEAGEWLQPLAEGKPLETWPMVPLVLLTPWPLAAIRGLHVFAGMIAIALTYRLALRVADRSTAFASGLLFAVCPFLVYLQRFALSDTLLCAAGVGVLLSVIKLLASPTWRGAAVLAFALVLAALCKLPVGFFFLASLPMALPFMPAQERGALLRPNVLIRLLAAHAPAMLLALLVAGVALVRVRQGRSPGFGLQDLMAIGMGQYGSIAAAIGVPRPNLIGELIVQLSWPVVAAGLVGLIAGVLLHDWRQRWLIAMGAVPALAIGVFAEFWYSRYLLFTLPPLIIGATCGWDALALRAGRLRPLILTAVFAVCLGLMVRQSARIVLDPLAARWSPTDRFQYFEGWGSGYGYPEAARFLLTTPDTPRMIYALDGHSAYQLRTYLPPAWTDRVRPVFYGEHGETLRTEESRLANLRSHTPAWIIVSPQLLPQYLRANFGGQAVDRIALRQVAEFAKPGSRARLAIYEARQR